MRELHVAVPDERRDDVVSVLGANDIDVARVQTSDDHVLFFAPVPLRASRKHSAT